MLSSHKVSPGEPFKAPPATIWNNMLDAGEAFSQSRLSGAANPFPYIRQQATIKVKNGSGGARSRGEVLGDFSKTLTDLEPEYLWLTGDTPAAGGHFGVLLHPVASNDYVDMQIAGACLATVNIQDTNHKFADIVDGQYKLRSSTAGPVEIFYAPNSTGDQECCVIIGTRPAQRFAVLNSSGCTAASGTTPGSGTATIHEYNGTATSACTGSGSTFTVYNFYTQSVPGDARIGLTDWCGYPFILTAEC